VACAADEHSSRIPANAMDFSIRINNAAGVGIHNDNTESKRFKHGG
jgi:hypothetical protein